MPSIHNVFRLQTTLKKTRIKLYNTLVLPVIFGSETWTVNLEAPCVLYIGQAFRYSPENAFYIFNQQIYFFI